MHIWGKIKTTFPLKEVLRVNGVLGPQDPLHSEDPFQRKLCLMHKKPYLNVSASSQLVRWVFSQGILIKKLMNGQLFNAEFPGFSTKKLADLAMATKMTRQVRAHMQFPVWTKGICRLPYGVQKLRRWPELLIKVKDWHGRAIHAKPRCLIRSARPKLWMNPHTSRISCRTGSFWISKPCLRCRKPCLTNFPNSCIPMIPKTQLFAAACRIYRSDVSKQVHEGGGREKQVMHTRYALAPAPPAVGHQLKVGGITFNYEVQVFWNKIV